MSKRTGVSLTLKKQVFEKYGEKCAKCGSLNRLEVHHIKPVCKGGTDDLHNLIPLCRSCHRYTPDDYISFLRYLGEPYIPILDVLSSYSLAMVKYFHELVNDTDKEYELSRFKEGTPEQYYRETLKPIFDAFNKMVGGYDGLD